MNCMYLHFGCCCYAAYTGDACSALLNGATVKNKHVLVARGLCSFSDKAINLAVHSAASMILIDSGPGKFHKTVLLIHRSLGSSLCYEPVYVGWTISTIKKFSLVLSSNTCGNMTAW
jgi:hypothetical protein